MKRRREAILREMGLAPLWKLRQQETPEEIESPEELVQEAATPASRPIPRSRLSPRPESRTAVEPAAQAIETPSPALSSPPTEEAEARRRRIASLDWEALEADIRACTACRLCEQRQQAVPGVGDREARIMFIGEGPGAEEDRRGEPFVGAAGKLLDAMLGSIGLQRQQGVYIANTVKCRPPRNRTPEEDEIAVCRPYLDRQIELIKPQLLVALGRPAAQTLLNSSDVRIGAARRQNFEHAAIPLFVTYHPAYLLRNPLDKALAWEDLCRMRAHLSSAGDKG